MAQTATSKRLAARPAETNPYHRAVPVKGSFSGMSTTEGQRSQRVGQVVAQQHYPVTRRRGHGPEEEEEEGSEGNLTDGGWTDDGAEFDHVDSLGMAPSTVPTNYTPTIVSYVAKRDPGAVQAISDCLPGKPRIVLLAVETLFLCRCNNLPVPDQRGCGIMVIGGDA